MRRLRITMIRLAFKEASKSNCGRRHGATVVKNGKTVSAGHNLMKTHPTWGSGRYDRIHAEGMAIRNAVNQGIDVVGATIYVVRADSGMSRPCLDCQILIERYGIRKVVYTDGNGISEEWP